MQVKYKFPYLCESFILIASVLLALFTYLQPGELQTPGIDASWAYGLNYAFQHHLIIGKDIYFTFGPLGFLEHTAPLTLSILNTSSNFWFACSIVSNFLVLVLCLESARTKWHFILNILLALTLIFFTSDHIQRTLIIAYTCVFLHWRTQNFLYLLLISASVAISLMIKFSYGITLLALYIPYLLAISLRDKRLSNAIIGIAIFLACYLFFWFCIYGALSGSIEYLKGGLDFSQGSISAMALNPANNWIAIISFYIAFLCGVMIVGYSYRKTWIIMPLCFLGPLYIWSKYAFGREESWHLAYLMYFVFYLGLLWLISIETLLQKAACLVSIIACFFAFKLMSLTATTEVEFTPRLIYSKPETFRYRWNSDHKILIKIMKADSAKAMEPLLLDPEIRRTIGTSSVDIYPWETLIAEANDLHWTPRPIYQSYITYTPFLDRKNYDFYESAKAPEFIIWHYHSFQDIDNRYPFSSDPLTLQAILQHYHREQCKGFFCLWRRTQHDQLLVNSLSPTTNASWNTWIDLPSEPHADIIRAHIKAQRTILGKLNMTLWKEGGIEIDYHLKNGEIKTYTLVLDNAISGIWASPYISEGLSNDTPISIEKKQLKELLTKNPAEGYIEKAESVAQGIHVVGWGLLPFKPSQTQQLRLLLTSDAHTYLVNVQNRSRPGITEHFKKTGIVDLDSCGFDETIDSHNIAPDAYQLGFVVENEGETRTYTQKPPITINVLPETSENIHNVTAIRLRTTRPWAFTQSFTLNWSGMTFTEKIPW